MENSNNYKLPDFDEINNESALRDIEKYRIKAADKFAEKSYLLERDGVPFAPRGNICAVAAEKKAGKSWFCMALASAATSGDFLGMKAREENLSVVYFDTEQDKGDGQKIQKRVHYANKWDFDTDNDRFQIFHLREESPEERRRIVMNITSFLRPDMVIVDGMRDLMKDFNDTVQSQDVVEDHMRLSSAINCCIWDVLHVNPGTVKMRGALGTELGNKLADLIFLSKMENPQNEDDVVYKAKETDARGHKNIRSIYFLINDLLPYGMTELVGEKKVDELENEEFNRLDAIMKATEFRANGKSWTELEKDLKTAGYGRNERHRMIKDATTNGILLKADNGRYYYMSGRSIEKSTDIPFDKGDKKPPF